MSSAQQVDKEQVEFTVVQQGLYGRHAKDVHVQSITSEKEATTFGVKTDVSQTDFALFTLIYVASGSKPTGGYSVLIKKVTFDPKKNQIDVYARDKEPKDQFGTMATTQPFAVVRIAKKEGAKVRVHWAKKKEN